MLASPARRGWRGLEPFPCGTGGADLPAEPGNKHGSDSEGPHSQAGAYSHRDRARFAGYASHRIRGSLPRFTHKPSAA